MELFNYIMDQLGTLGAAALTFIKILGGIILKVLELLVDIFRRGLSALG